jgi:hypothetical protein
MLGGHPHVLGGAEGGGDDDGFAGGSAVGSDAVAMFFLRSFV